MAENKIIAELPDGTEKEFPAGTTLDAVKAWVKKTLTTGIDLSMGVTPEVGPLLSRESASRGVIPGRKIAGELANIPYGPTSSPVGKGIVKGLGGVVEDMSSPAALSTAAGTAVLGGVGAPGLALGATFSVDALRRAYNDLTGLGEAKSTEEKAEKATGAGVNAFLAASPFVGALRGGRRAPAGMPEPVAPPPRMAPSPGPVLEAPGPSLPTAGAPATSPAAPAVRLRRPSGPHPHAVAVANMLARGARPAQTPRPTPRVSSPEAPPSLPMAPVEAPPGPSIRSVNIPTQGAPGPNVPTRGNWSGQPKRGLPSRTPPPWSRTAAEVLAENPPEPVQMGAPISGKAVTSPPIPTSYADIRARVVNDAVEWRLGEMEEIFGSGIGSSSKKTIVDPTTREVIGRHGKINLRDGYPELREAGIINAPTGQIAKSLQGRKGPRYEAVKAAVRKYMDDPEGEFAGYIDDAVQKEVERRGMAEPTGDESFDTSGWGSEEGFADIKQFKKRGPVERVNKMFADRGKIRDEWYALSNARDELLKMPRGAERKVRWSYLTEQINAKIKEYDDFTERYLSKRDDPGESGRVLPFSRDEEGFARFKNPDQGDLFGVKQSGQPAASAPSGKGGNPMLALADEFLSGQMRRRETVLREAIGRVVQGAGSWAAKRRQVGLPEAEVPISAPEIERLVKAKLSESGQ